MKQTATLNYRLERLATALLAVLAAALVGWAVALALGLWGQHLASRLPAWAPFDLSLAELGRGPVAAAPVVAGASRLVGVAGDRAYFVTGSAPNVRALSLAVGDALPSGEKLLRIDRAAVVLASGSGETRVPVLADRAAPPSSAPVSALASCRLSGADRAAAIFLQPAMVKALAAERATFARMFEPVAGAAGGIRAKGTGGTTAMFQIEDGDLLLRADGTPLKSGEAIATDILGRVDRGASVAVDGERKGAPKRWVYAPSSCSSSSSTPSSSASKSSG